MAVCVALSVCWRNRKIIIFGTWSPWPDQLTEHHMGHAWDSSLEEGGRIFLGQNQSHIVIWENSEILGRYFASSQAHSILLWTGTSKCCWRKSIAHLLLAICFLDSPPREDILWSLFNFCDDDAIRRTETMWICWSSRHVNLLCWVVEHYDRGGRMNLFGSKTCSHHILPLLLNSDAAKFI